MSACREKGDSVPLLGLGTGADQPRARAQQRIILTTKRRKMSQRANLIGIFGVSCLCIWLLIATTQQYPLLSTNLVGSSIGNDDRVKLNPAALAALHEYNDQRREYGFDGLPTVVYQSIPIYNMTATIDDVLAAQRARIAAEMKNFEYPSGKFNVAAKKLSDLTPETNGVPIRSIILSSWRSGSTFTGAILNAIPGNYYHYESLLDFGIIRVRDEMQGRLAVRNLVNLLHCDYSSVGRLLEFGKHHKFLFEHNERLWNVCKDFPHYCWDPKFLNQFCKLFPIQSMKTVRLSLSLAEQLLLDKSLNVRVILLVRDPRGTMQSRKHRSWCAGNPDCEDSRMLCKDLVDEYNLVNDMLNKYPQRFRTLRYEDLSLNPYEMSQEILQFYGLPFDPMVKEFLNTHTKVTIGDFRSTHRDSKSAPLHWRQDLKIEEIKYIQSECAEAMNLWGYRPIENFTNFQNTFDPIILPPPFVY